MKSHSKPEEIKLSNGIPVILQNIDSQVGALYWWIQTGSADEKPNEYGFAHFLEHMHFKDTDAKASGKASVGELASAIEGFGGDVNAYTSFDQTVYHVTCAQVHWERVIDVFGQMAKPQRFLKEDFNREREVILEELKKNNDSASRQLFQQLFTATYSKHPYGRPVIGYEKVLKKATVKDLEAFYQRQYVSSNMGIVLVGPYDETRKKKLIALLEKKYGSKVIKNKPARTIPRKFDPEEQKNIESIYFPFSVKTPTLLLSFRIPELMHEDTGALDLAGSVLGMGEMSRLYQSLFYQKSLVSDVNGGTYVPKDPGMLYFSLELADLSKTELALHELMKELIKLRDEGPTEEELKRVITNIESEKYYAAQSADGVAGRLAFLKFQLGDLNFDQHYLDRIKNIDSDRIKETLSQYLSMSRLSLVMMVPKENDLDPKGRKEFNSKLIKIVESYLVQKEKTKKSFLKPRELPIEIQLSSGVKVLYKPRPDSHLVSLYGATLGGLRLESAESVTTPARDQGASSLLSQIWTQGTHSKTSQEISRAIEGMAASLDGFSGKNTMGLSSVGLSRDWDKISNLYREVLFQASFPQEELEHARRVALENIRSIEDSSGALSSRLFQEALYEKHPYGKYVLGTLKSVEEMQRDQLVKFHQKWMRPDRFVMSVVGNLNQRQLDEFVLKLDEDFKSFQSQVSKSFHQTPSQVKLESEPQLVAPRWVEKNLKREQVHLIRGGLGMSFYDEKDKSPMRVLQTLLGGQSGRLFIELREKKSLGYSVAPLHTDGMEKGYIGTYIACSRNKIKEAEEGIQKVYEDLVRKAPSDKELSRAKEYYLGQRAMGLQGDQALSSTYTMERVYGVTLKEESQIAKEVNAVSAKQVQEVCRKYLVEPHQVTSIVG